jgi:hypothetical protein
MSHEQLVYTFECPWCGGRTWGTAFASDPERATGHCQSCDFAWSRANDEELFPQLEKEVPMAAQLSLEVLCDDCFPGGEEKTLGMISPRRCARCNKLCGPGTTVGAHWVPTRVTLERVDKERALTKAILDLAGELLELSPDVRSLILTRENRYVLSIEIRNQDTIPAPPPEPEA